VIPIDVPKDSRVRNEIDTAYFHDTFEIQLKSNDKTALELYLGGVGRTPGWINFLMAVRNRVVAIFGLKNLGNLSNIEPDKEVCTYKVGDRVGIFSILSVSDQEVILGDADKHLSAKISIYKYSDESKKLAVTTVVHVNNLLGQVYLFFVVPVHKVIVPSMLARIVESEKNA
jgi:hypothetical protein